MAASEARIIILENKLNDIMKKLEKIEDGTTNMSKHIEFIESVYNTVSTPMYWICNKVNRLRGEIKDSKPPILTSAEIVNENKKVDVLEQD